MLCLSLKKADCCTLTCAGGASLLVGILVIIEKYNPKTIMAMTISAVECSIPVLILKGWPKMVLDAPVFSSTNINVHYLSWTIQGIS